MLSNLKRPSTEVILYCLVNFIYVLYYGLNILPQSIYYLSVILFIAYGLFCILSGWGWCFSLEYCKSKTIIKKMGFFIITIFVISMGYQIIHLDFESYLFKYLLNMILPLMTVFCMVEMNDEEVDSYIYILFIRQFVLFIITEGANFSISNLLAINIMDSGSSLTENGMAHVFLLLTIIFLFKKKYVPAVFATVLCIASFKRFCLLYCLIAWIGFRFLPKKPVNGVFCTVLKIVFILSPVFMNWLYSDTGALWFQSTFNMDLDTFVSSRYSLATMVKDHFNGIYNGYGTIKNFFATKSSYWAMIAAIHCDLLEMLWECTIVSVIVLVNNLVELARKDYRILFMVFYFLMELVLTHFMSGYPEWVLLYLFIYMVQKESGSVKEMATVDNAAYE